MEPPSPARLYATLAGAFLFVFGLAGFFSDLSWLNFLHVASGAIALLLANAAARACALILGIAFTGLAVFAFGGDGWLHLTVGVLGLAAAAGTSPKPGASEARAQPLGKRP